MPPSVSFCIYTHTLSLSLSLPQASLSASPYTHSLCFTLALSRLMRRSTIPRACTLFRC
jgi:hypothetical protein